MKKIFTLIALLSVSLMGWADSNICGVAPEHPAAAGSTHVLFSWNTADNGDVVVSIAPGEGTTSASFRGSGFTGDVNQFKVLSGEGFATEENASKYFYEKDNVNGQSTYTLYRTGTYNLPSPCKIRYTPGAIEWSADGIYPYDNSSTIIYDYGTVCGSTLDAPVIAVDESGIVSFDDVSGADSYRAYVYSGAELIKECPVTSGQKVWNPYYSGDYAIRVRSFNSSTNAYSDFSDGGIWSATGSPSGDKPKSQYCDKEMDRASNYPTVTNDQHSLIGFTWETLPNGNVLITLSEKDGGDPGTALFRGNGMNIANFYIDGVQNNGDNAIFETEASHANLDYYTLIVKEGKSAPADRAHITYNGTVEYKTATSTDAWPTLSFDYTYGRNCDEVDDHVAPEVTLTKVSTTTTSTTLQIDVTEVNDYSEIRPLRSFTIRDAANSFAEQNVTLNGSNQVTLEGLKKNTIYNFTVKAEDKGGNMTEETIKVPLTFDTEENLALNKDCSAGGATDPAKNANDGKQNTHWGTYALGDYGTKNVWEVDLGQAYVLDSVAIYADGYAGGAAHTVILKGKMKAEDDWSVIFDNLSVAASSVHRNVPAVASARYLQFSAAATENWMFAVNEFEVYGHDYAVPDATDPTVSVSEISKTVNSVTLQINAADKDDAGDDGTIHAINISGDHGFVTQNNVVLDGSYQITLSGLTYNKTYHFTIQVVDLAGNDATANIEVALPFNTNYNLSLQGTATAGYRENENTKSAKAIDGDAGTKWNTWGVGSSEGGYANNWMRVDLKAVYNLSSVAFSFDWHYGNPVTNYAIEGSLDDSNWYMLAHVTDQSATSANLTVNGPARYVRFRAITEQSLGIYEFEVYASGFSTLTDAQPVITWAKVGTVDDATAEIEIDAVDITTKPITEYQVSGSGISTQVLTASEGKITMTGLAQSTHYTINVQAKDGSGNLSAAKQVEFTTEGSVSGLYFFSDYFNWNKTAEGAQFTTTAEPGVLSVTIANMTAGGHTFKLYNAGADRCTRGDCSGTTNHHFANSSAKNVTIYATDEDHFVCSEDELYLCGTLVGDDQAMEWNDAHTVATWTGAIDLSGTKQFNVIKKNVVGETTYTYTQDFYAEAQTFDGDYTYGTFTLDLTKMTGVWSYVGLSFADNATDNATVIAANDGRIANVTLNRTILANDTWYTLCLPFDMSAAKVTEVFGSSTIAEMTGAEDRGSLIHLNFDYVNAIEAGKAYLFKPGITFTAGTIIEGVTINNVTPIVSGDELMHFQGTYDATMLTADNIRFVADDDYLYSPAEGGTTMGAFRCYFTIPDGSPASAPGRRAKIFFGEETPTDVENIQIAEDSVRKILRDGIFLIIRDGRTYNAQGMLIK